MRLLPIEWRAVLFGLGSFILDLQHAAAELEEADAIALPALATTLTAFQITIRTTLSLRFAVETALERNHSAKRFRRGKAAGSGRVAVRHTALSALPSILDDAAQRLVEAGHGVQAETMRAMALKVCSVLP
jgi:predicted ABC-type ATPase